jgi:hypothetical protein
MKHDTEVTPFSSSHTHEAAREQAIAKTPAK